MNEKIMEEYQKYLRGRYRNKNTRKNNYKFAKLFLGWVEEEKGKSYSKLTKEDTKDTKLIVWRHTRSTATLQG